MLWSSGHRVQYIGLHTDFQRSEAIEPERYNLLGVSWLADLALPAILIPISIAEVLMSIVY